MWFEFNWASSLQATLGMLCVSTYYVLGTMRVFFHSPILACDSVARNGLGFLIVHARTLRLKDLLFLFLIDHLSHHTLGVIGTVRVQR